MAVSRIEEKILGRLARDTAPSNALLSASLYQVLGLTILLTRSLAQARRRRRLDDDHDAESQSLYHHIIWLAREGLSITEVYVLPYCQDGEQGPECRVMAAKLRASFYNVFCLYHNNPPVGQMTARSNASSSPQSTALSPKANNGQSRRSPGTPSRSGKDGRERSGSKRAGKAPLRDPIPSMTSETSYITNPYAGLPSQTPPPHGPPPPIPTEPRRTPIRPPGLAPISVSASQSAASYLLPPMDFIPLARGHFDTAQHLAISLLPPTHALRLAVGFDYALWLWDCAREVHRSRRLARRTIKDVYDSSEGLSDEEFADASALVQSLGGIVRRGTNESTPRASRENLRSPTSAPPPPPPPMPHFDRSIAVSPPQNSHAPSSSSAPRMTPPGPPSQYQRRSPRSRTPGQLSTVPEVESADLSRASHATIDDDDDDDENPDTERTRNNATTTPPTSRLSSRSRGRRGSSTSSEKVRKRKAAEQAEERYRRDNNGAGGSRSRQGSQGSVGTGGSGGGSRNHSRQATPQDGITAASTAAPANTKSASPQGSKGREMGRSRSRSPPHPLSPPRPPPPPPATGTRAVLLPPRVPTPAEDRRAAILKTLEIITSVSKGLYVPEKTKKEQRRHGRRGSGATRVF